MSQEKDFDFSKGPVSAPLCAGGVSENQVTLPQTAPPSPRQPEKKRSFSDLKAEEQASMPSDSSGKTPVPPTRKRIRASPEQLAYLEEVFSRNPSPSSKQREMISERLGLPERTVQVWFQNRRARAKLQQRKASLNGATSSGPGSVISAASSSNYSRSLSMDSAKTPAGGSISFLCESLVIGSWRRISVKVNDLLCSADLKEKMLRWEIVEGSNAFRIEIPFASLASIQFEQLDAFYGKVGFSCITIPLFSMKLASGWSPCQDFSEDQQASTVLLHEIKGHSVVLRQNLKALCVAEPTLKSLIADPSGVLLSPNPNQFVRRGSCPNILLNNPRSDKGSLRRASLAPTLNRGMTTPFFAAPSAATVLSPITGGMPSPLATPSPLTARRNSVIFAGLTPQINNLDLSDHSASVEFENGFLNHLSITTTNTGLNADPLSALPSASIATAGSAVLDLDAFLSSSATALPTLEELQHKADILDVLSPADPIQVPVSADILSASHQGILDILSPPNVANPTEELTDLQQNMLNLSDLLSM